MDESELEDAREIISRHGGNPKDFVFEVKEEQADGIGIQPIRYKVSAVFGEIRPQYQGGHALNWLSLFEADIKRGVFGRDFRANP